jgi:hypothetical protein
MTDSTQPMQTIVARPDESILDAIARAAPTVPVKVQKTVFGQVMEITYIPPQYTPSLASDGHDQ